jgi:hypothetical protein
MITTFIILLVAAPFYLMADWFALIDRMQPRQAELTKASHGVVMIVGAWLGYAHLQVDRFFNFTFDEKHLIYCFLAFVALWGAWWVATGAMRSRGPRDLHLIGRALAKILMPVAVAYFVGRYIEKWDADYRWWINEFGYLALLWCVVTGVTKLFLLMRSPPTMDLDDDDDDRMVHGRSKFRGGGRLGQ